MTHGDTNQLIRRLIGGDTAAQASIAELAGQISDDALLLTAAALIRPEVPALLDRAARTAVTTRDRQLVAIVTAHLAGNHELVDALARDHLVDFPGSLLAAWIASIPSPSGPSAPTATSAPTAPSAPAAPAAPSAPAAPAAPAENSRRES